MPKNHPLKKAAKHFHAGKSLGYSVRFVSTDYA